MRLFHENQLLTINVRKQLVQEIRGPEETDRRDEAYRRYVSWKGKNKELVTKELIGFFQQSTVERMQYALSNVNITKKVIGKLSRVYSHGVDRTIRENEIATAKLEIQEDQLCADQKFKTLNKFVKLENIAEMFVKPIMFKDSTGETVTNAYTQLIPMAPYLYSVVEQDADHTKKMALIFSDYFNKQRATYSSIDPENRSHSDVTRMPDPLKAGDGKNQGIADSPEDEDAVEGEDDFFVLWSDSYHFTLNQKGEFVDPRTRQPFDIEVDADGSSNDDRVTNPIKVLPSVTFSLGQDESFWVEGGQDLVDGCVRINSMITNMDHIANIQGFGQFWMKGKGLNNKTIPMGPDRAITIDIGEDDENASADIGYASGNPMLGDMRENIKMYTGLLLTTNNLSTSGIKAGLDAPTAASGIALIIDQSESMEDVKDQQKIFSDGEPAVWDINNKWLGHFNVEGWLDDKHKATILTESELDNFMIDFGEPKVITAEGEKLDNIAKRKDLGLNMHWELLQKDRPDLTDEDAKALALTIEKEKSERLLNQMGDADGKEDDGDGDDELGKKRDDDKQAGSDDGSSGKPGSEDEDKA